jgi:hypothetical protein
LSSGGDPIQFRQADIKNDQIGLEFLGFLNRIQSIHRLRDDLKFSPFL